MARMFPENGPQQTDSPRAEPSVYWHFSNQLSDDFIVIHSLPWLASVAKEIDGRPVPTGEIDFLIIHKSLGILAVEVKGGVLSYDRTNFVYKRTGQRIQPIRQVRRGTHALAKWLHRSGAGSWRIGYCILLPQSEITDSAIPMALVDGSAESAQPIVLGMESLSDLGSKIQDVMLYWQHALENKPINEEQLQKLIDIVMPSSDYSPCWQTIIGHDTYTWLRLRPEQAECLERIEKSDRFVVTGLPGTGKTLLLIENARKLSASGKKVLIITFNDLLSKKLREDLPDKGIEVCTFHEQCRRAARASGVNPPVTGTDVASQRAMEQWYSIDAAKFLRRGVDEKILEDYDTLIVDEGQALDGEWWRTLSRWFVGKQIFGFCDPTQSFDFEHSTSGVEIAEIISADNPYVLTINLRSPKTVFDRISQARPTTYQQFCPRPVQQGSLTEIVVTDTKDELDRVIDELKQDEIPSSFITIIDTTNSLQRRDRYRDIRCVSSARFRGLESPVVIVWAGSRSDETSIFCAYTRATSRCIVIYDAVEVIKGSYGRFGHIISALDKSGKIEEEARSSLTSGVFEEQDFCLVPIAEETIKLSWCSDWNGWLLFPTEEGSVEQSMWLYHLMSTTPYPTFSWGLFDRGILRCFEPINGLDDCFGTRCYLTFCDYCEMLTPFEILPTNELGDCLICSREEHELSPSERDRQYQCDQTLLKGKHAARDMKRSLSISLMALGRWRSIPVNKRELFEEELAASGSVGYHIAHLLVLTDLILNKDSNFKLAETAERYREVWCPDLESRISKKKWHSLVALGFNAWIQREMIQKISKGVYEKTEKFRQRVLRQ